MSLREVARRIFLGTLEELRIEKVMARQIHCTDGVLQVGSLRYSLHEFRRIRVVSVGKAALPMAAALMKALGPEMTANRIVDGIVVGTEAAQYPNLRCFVGGHPIPNERSLMAAGAVLELLSSCAEDCVVFFLISGGASAMLEQALDASMTTEDMTAFHQVLVHSGLRIQDMNALRKHLSAVKGGRLAVAAGRATQCTLLVSDVPNGLLHVVGSGPTMPDPSTVEDCREILAQHGNALPFSGKVMHLFESSALPETPKKDDEVFERASSFALLSSDDFCEEARRQALSEGFHVVIDNRCDEWAYQDAAAYLLRRIEGLRKEHGRVCLLSAGEISVKVDGKQGTGGRNQHFVLACARGVAKSGQRVTVLSAGTDGIDGNSDAAGAVADETTIMRTEVLGLDVNAALAHFDSNKVFHRLGDALVTGPSGNNVRDLRILLCAE